MATAYLGLGSNHPQARRYLDSALSALRDAFGSVDVSESIVTDAVNGVDPPYTNAAARISTALEPEALNRELKAIEASLGRTRPAVKTHPNIVEIDIDLVVYDGDVLRPRDFSAQYFAPLYQSLL